MGILSGKPWQDMMSVVKMAMAMRIARLQVYLCAIVFRLLSPFLSARFLGTLYKCVVVSVADEATGMPGLQAAIHDSHCNRPQTKTNKWTAMCQHRAMAFAFVSENAYP